MLNRTHTSRRGGSIRSAVEDDEDDGVTARGSGAIAGAVIALGRCSISTCPAS
jgi:hypothetical protein